MQIFIYDFAIRKILLQGYHLVIDLGANKKGKVIYDSQCSINSKQKKPLRFNVKKLNLDKPKISRLPLQKPILRIVALASHEES